MATSAQQIRNYQGPAILSYGFRPLFLLGGLWAALAMAIWVLLLTGKIYLPTGFSALDWHVHELLFGYLPIVAAGFLLTAVPNWTGRLPVTGMPLLTLSLIWVAGRFAVAFSAIIGAGLAAAVDLAFLVTLAAIIAREIIAGKNWRNLKVLGLMALLLVANAVYHREAGAQMAAYGYGARIGIATALMLIMVIGGRIIPSFTRNWLARQPPGKMPASFDTFDMTANGAGGLALTVWIIAPDHMLTAGLCLMAAMLHGWRLARWAGYRTWREPLVLVLHAGYFFVPAGFFLTGLAVFFPQDIRAAAGIHAWTAGAIGVMTIAVMTRASLGHAGRALHASTGISSLYGMLILGAVLRIAAGTGLTSVALLHAAALLWGAAFALFSILYWPILTQPKR